MTNRVCYPRPDFLREQWHSLNGPWRFAFDDKDEGRTDHWEARIPDAFEREIRVPFSYQSSLSGIGESDTHEILWYAKEFELPDGFLDKGRHAWLCFGAVDWQCDVWLNGRHLCSHEGGYTPFSADLTYGLNPGAKQVLVIRVEDTLRCDQPRGKQSWQQEPDRCWYTPCSGIWQSVWLQSLPETYVQAFTMQPDLANSSVKCTLILPHAPQTPLTADICITYKGQTVTAFSTIVTKVQSCFTVPITEADYVDEIHYWSPEHPNLYDVRVTLHTPADCDTVQTYFGMRSIQVRDGRILLNNRPFYQKLLLHQGYYADGLLTAADDDDYRKDLLLIKSMGFNGIRMHQKIEDPLLYYWADRLGLAVWGELPSCYEFNSVSTSRTVEMMRAFVQRDCNHPSILCWVPLNESWGVRNIYDNTAQQQYALGLYHFIKAMDSTRLVSTNDGWEQVETDLCCLHDYSPNGLTLKRKWDDVSALVSTSAADRMAFAHSFHYSGQPLILSEFGGIAYKTNHSAMDWGYARVETDEDGFCERLLSLMRYINSHKEIQGFCYTQFTDVMQEVNGLTDIHRQPKIAVEKLRRILQGIADTGSDHEA